MCLALIPISLAVFKSRQLDLLYTRMFSGQTVAAQNEKQREKDEKAYLHSGLGRCNDAENKLIPRARYFLRFAGTGRGNVSSTCHKGARTVRTSLKKTDLSACCQRREQEGEKCAKTDLSTCYERRQREGKCQQQQQQQTIVSACYERGEREGEKCKK